MKIRLTILLGVFIIAISALVYKLFYWQVIKGGELTRAAQSQHESGDTTMAPRGNILASDGTWLAASTQSWLIFAQRPDITESPRIIANKIAPILEPDKDKILAKTQKIEGILDKEGTVWIPIEHKVSTDVKKNIEALNIKGIGFQEEDARYYPEASSSAQILGFVGKSDDGSDRGYFGLEGYYDLSLSGKPGLVQREADARGIPILFGSSKEIAPVRGVDIQTHIDKTIQAIVEKKLKEGIDTYGAISGNVTIMDPKTGAILAMASYPSYDPSKYSQFSESDYRNPVISDSFEPGSIFKPLIMAAGLDAGVIKVDTKCDICDKPLKIDKYEIETWDGKYRADETMTDVIVHSDNVGMSFIGEKLGMDKLYSYLQKYGIGSPTEIDLQGEQNPGMRERSTWNIVDQATATFGQGIAVTPIQMVKAMAVIANGGKVVKPQVVDKVIREGWEDKIKPETGITVLSAKATKEVTEMMIQAVDQGEAKWAKPQGFVIAGKTGTAQIPIAGHYDPTKTITSFIGFAPANNARFVMLVSLREPKTSQWGSETAAPLWFNIARDIFPYLGIQPN